MTLLDRLRIERAVVCYDFWLDLRGTPGRQRRGLRRELRANLLESASRRGARAAVAGLQGTRRMAAEAIVADLTRPRWSAGGTAALATFAFVFLVQMSAALAWVDGAMAAAPGRATRGAVTFFPGAQVEYEPAAAGFSVAMTLGWLAPALAVAVFLAVARPWRLRAGG